MNARERRRREDKEKATMRGSIMPSSAALKHRGKRLENILESANSYANYADLAP